MINKARSKPGLRPKGPADSGVAVSRIRRFFFFFRQARGPSMTMVSRRSVFRKCRQGGSPMTLWSAVFEDQLSCKSRLSIPVVRGRGYKPGRRGRLPRIGFALDLETTVLIQHGEEHRVNAPCSWCPERSAHKQTRVLGVGPEGPCLLLRGV